MDNCEQITRFRTSTNDSKDRSTKLHDISSVRSLAKQHSNGKWSVCITSEIAQGATSFVYQAEDTVSGQIYALKKIICQSEEQRRMAEHEIQLHKVFKHPNIMPLIDHAEVAGGSICHEYYLLFPFMQEGALRDRIDISIEQKTSLSERWILDRFLELCKAIAEFHTHTPALAHRDIKPENIMISETGNLILTDLGSVTEGNVYIPSQTEALLLQEKASQMTSMPYRAPELYQVPAREHITTKTDVWSLGCVLYAMAFGYSPTECFFTSSDSIRIIECSSLSVLGPIKFPSKIIYSTQFHEFIRHMLTHDPSLRPTIDQIITQLHEWESSL